MSFLGSLSHNLRRRRHVEQDLDEEVRAHLELLVDQRRATGLDEAAARRAAQLELGGIGQVKDAVRDVRRGVWLEQVWRDLQYATRMLRRAPLFSAVAILTLSLCIGANTALFSVVNAVLLRPLTFDRASELYVVSSTYQGVRREFTSFSDFSDWRAMSRDFTQMAAIRGDRASVTTPSGPESLTVAAVSEDFFALFRMQPFLGRTFLNAEHRPGQARVVILSHGLWLRRFGGDSAVIGTSVVLDGEPHTVAGVMAPGFAFPDDAELWRPLTLTASDASRRVDIVRVVARMRPGVAPAQAQAELAGIARQLEQRFPSTNANWGVQLVSLQAKSTEDVRQTLLALWGAVACVLLIGCANVGILLLSRGLRRAHELAIRTALGADRGRIVRQLLTESVFLAGLGGSGSLLVAAWGIFALRALAPAQASRFDNVRLDLPVLLFTAALSLGTGLLVGVVPVWRVMRSDVHSALREGERSASRSRRHHHAMRILAAGQVMVALVLLIGAGLMIRTLERLQAVPLGFNPDHLLTFYVSLPDVHYPQEAQKRAFFQELLDRIRALPGVRSASAVNALYIHWSRAYVLPVLIDGRPALQGSHPPDTHIRIVDPDIHRVLQIPVLRGRSFTAQDGPDSPKSVVINAAMASEYFAGENPVGHRISVLSSASGRPIWEEIVGVVGNVRQQGLDADVFPEIQIPFTQSAVNTLAMLVRTAAELAALTPAIRAQARALDPNLPLTFMQTMDDVMATSLASRRFGMRLLSAFGSLALMLTGIGLYGVMAAGVSDRTREIAVRLALGGSPSRVVWMVVRQMLIVTLTGVTAGVAVALGATRYLEPLLFGIPRTDFATYGTTAAILVIATVASSYLPARRVTRVDPATTLRSE
jgi:putative ABC transport system permease protein